jgi:hypothetical protein
MARSIFAKADYERILPKAFTNMNLEDFNDLQTLIEKYYCNLNVVTALCSAALPAFFCLGKKKRLITEIDRRILMYDFTTTRRILLSAAIRTSLTRTQREVEEKAERLDSELCSSLYELGRSVSDCYEKARLQREDQLKKLAMRVYWLRANGGIDHQ